MTMAQNKRVRGVATQVFSASGALCCKYHDTIVARLIGVSEVQLDSGGWETRTTKLRMNQFANQYCGGRFVVFQRKGEWYVARHLPNEHIDANGLYWQDEVPFEDGMTITIR
jgi:hypothetical protein